MTLHRQSRQIGGELDGTGGEAQRLVGRLRFVAAIASAAWLVLWVQPIMAQQDTASVARGSLDEPPVKRRPEISLRNNAPKEGLATFVVTNLDRHAMARLAAIPSDARQWAKVLSVHVEAGDTATSLPVLGEYELTESELRFTPRFPLEAGLRYRAVYRWDNRNDDSANRLLRRVFEIPRPRSARSTELVHVFPTRGVLPENQLKFYLHFSAPMSRGQAYRRIHLYDPSGVEVESPFLELREELWDADDQRFTLFIYPGRIKRGLRPYEELGPALRAGGVYTLVVDREWLDAQGRPLAASVRKPFQVTPPDYRQPDPRKWRIDAPAAGTKRPLVVHFNEPLDAAMLHRVLTTVDAEGGHVAGEISVDEDETRWRFQPRQPWRNGAYELVVETTLEDLAGNSIGRPFERDMLREDRTPAVRALISLPFTVARRERPAREILISATVKRVRAPTPHDVSDLGPRRAKHTQPIDHGARYS